MGRKKSERGMARTPSAKIRVSVTKEQEKERESQEPVHETKKLGQEIEEIFRANRKNREESSSIREDRSTKAELRGDEKGKKKNTAKVEIEKKKRNKERYIMHENPESRAKRRRTVDGLPIYSAEELGIWKSDAGETPLCPFDCSCCF